MAITLRFLVDVYLQRWRRPQGQREIWAIVHAHVHRDELKDFARALDEQGGLSDVNCVMVDPGETQELVPIPLPANIDLEIQIHDALGGVLLARRNPRATGNHLVDGQRFLADNHDSLPSDDRIGDGPYARTYLRDARALLLSEQLPTERAIDWLRLGLWHGTRLRLGAGVIADQRPDCDRMDVEPLPGEQSVTNLHSMLGQTLRLHDDRVPGNPDWSRAEWVEVHLYQGAMALAHAPASDVPQARTAWRDIFTSLSQTPEDPASLLSWHPLSNVDRVSVIDIATRFEPCIFPGHAPVFRRRNERSGRVDSSDLDSSKITRAVLRHTPPTSRDPRQGFPKNPLPNIKFELFNTIELRLDRYRGSSSQGGSAGGLLLGKVDGNDLALLKQLHAHPARPLARARLAGASGERAALQWVGSFLLPWDDLEGQEAPTLLWFGDIAASAKTWTLFVPCLQMDGKAVELTLEPRDIADPRAPLGPRWEATDLLPLRALALPFDSAELRTPLTSEMDVANLSLSFYFDGDVGFRPSHGATQSEVIAGTRLRHDEALTRATNSTMVAPQCSAQSELAADLANYSVLNVLSQWQGASTLRNPHRDLFPQLSRCRPASLGASDSLIEQVYVWRARDDLPDSLDPQVLDAHFHAIGSPRDISLVLQHTTGDLIDDALRPVISISTRFDFPIVHPAEVGKVGPSDATADTARSHQFLSCEYRPAESTRRQKLRISLDLALLQAEHEDQARQAWRSLIELRHAERIELKLRAFRFDHRSATGRNLVDALVVLPRFPHTIDVTDVLGDWVDALLRGTPGTSAHLDFELAADLPDLVRTSHALRVELALHRSAAKCFDPHAPYRFNRLVWAGMTSADIAPDRPFDLDSPDALERILPAVALPTADWREPFADWIEQQRSRSAGIRRPLQNNHQQQLHFEQFCSGADESSWIVPVGSADVEGNPCACRIIPLGFRPLLAAPAFGHATGDVVARVLVLLKGLFDCSLPAMTGWVAADWQGWMSKLERVGTEVRQLCTRIAERLISPLPDPYQPGLPTPIRETLDALRNDVQGRQALAEIRQHVGRLLLANPALYAETKALLYVRLGRDGSPLSSDFTRLELSKSLDPSMPTSAATPPGNERHDRDQFWHFEAATRRSGGAWFGFVDVLDDLRYGNRCAIDGLRLDGFENLIGDSVLPLPIEDDQVLLPAGAQKLNPTGQTPVPLHLSARRAARAPAHLFSAMLEALQPEGALRLLPKRLVASAFGAGRIQAATSGDAAVELLLTQQASHRSRYIDRVIVTSVWVVEGSEEAGLPGFVRDLFEIRLTTAQQRKGVRAATAEDDFAALIKASAWSNVSEVPDESRNDVLSLIDATVVRSLTSLIEAARAPADAAQDSALHVRVREVSGSGFRIDALDPTPNPGQDPRVSTRGEAALLVGRNDDGGDRYFLLLNTELPVWWPVEVRARLLRNAGQSEVGAAFDRDFWTLGEEAPDHRDLSLERWVSLQNEPAAKLTFARCTPRQLVEQLLVATGLLPPTGALTPHSVAESGWTSLTAVITIEAVQKQSVWRSPGGPKVTELVEEVGRFPLTLLEVGVGAVDWDAPHTWAPEGYQDLVASIRWINDANFTVLAVSDRYFRLQ